MGTLFGLLLDITYSLGPISIPLALLTASLMQLALALGANTLEQVLRAGIDTQLEMDAVI